jgi:hypothetical protein
VSTNLPTNLPCSYRLGPLVIKNIENTDILLVCFGILDSGAWPPPANKDPVTRSCTARRHPLPSTVKAVGERGRAFTRCGHPSWIWFGACYQSLGGQQARLTRYGHREHIWISLNCDHVFLTKDMTLICKLVLRYDSRYLLGTKEAEISSRRCSQWPPRAARPRQIAAPPP